MIDMGIVKPGAVIHIPFGSYAAATGASSATTNYAAADVQIYKDGGLTQRASAAGITASTDFDSLTGINMVTIDLSDNTTADFYVSGSEFVVVIADVTIDTQTVRFPIARFVIGIPGAINASTIASLSSQTSFTLVGGSTNDNAYVGCTAYVQKLTSGVQFAMGVISAYTGASKTVTLAADPSIYTMGTGDHCMIFPRTNVYTLGGTVCGAGSIASVTGAVGSVTSSVNVGQLAGQTVTAAAGVTFPTSVASPTNITAGTITTVTNLTNAPTAGDLTATMKTSVKTQVTDGLNVDTYAEQAQGNPPATVTFRAMLQWIYMAWRNKSTQSSSQYSLYADDTTTVVAKSAVSDDGTTLTRAEVATGP